MDSSLIDIGFEILALYIASIRERRLDNVHLILPVRPEISGPHIKVHVYWLFGTGLNQLRIPLPWSCKGH